MNKIILIASLLLASSAYAGQPTTCDDARMMEAQVIAKARQKISTRFPANLVRQVAFSTNSQNVEMDYVHGGEVWTVQMTSPTGHALLRIHVLADDGGCLAQ
jgi:hypothetical protein